MKMNFKKLGIGVGALVGLLLAPSLMNAQCGGLRKAQATPASWHAQFGQARFLRAAFGGDTADDTAIVGFWHVKFVARGNAKVPDGTEIDAGYSQWHSDGTEIMNSAGRSPLTNAFCLGVWEKVGARQFQLNHFAAAYDATGTNLIGPANIRETVTVGPEGKHFSGPFTIEQYDEAGNSLSRVQGTVTGTRILVDTLPSSIF